MRVFLRSLLGSILTPASRKQLKRLEHEFKKAKGKLSPKMGEDDLRLLLTKDLRLQLGDTVMVHGGLSAVNTRLTPVDVRAVILDILGPRGNLVVPTFSPQAAFTYMQGPEIFDSRTSRSGMGAIAETVRTTPGAIRSLHPTKSVAVLGPDASGICAGHEACAYPFGMNSPFAKLLEHDARIIGIGVPMFYLSFVHVAEDMYPERASRPIWQPQPMHKLCRDGAHEITVSTYVHDLSTMARANPEKFCSLHVPHEAFVICQKFGAPFFSIRAQDLQQAILRGFETGFTIYD